MNEKCTHAHTVCYLDNPKHEVRMKTCGGNMFGRVSAYVDHQEWEGAEARS